MNGKTYVVIEALWQAAHAPTSEYCTVLQSQRRGLSILMYSKGEDILGRPQSRVKA